MFDTNSRKSQALTRVICNTFVSGRKILGFILKNWTNIYTLHHHRWLGYYAFVLMFVTHRKIHHVQLFVFRGFFVDQCYGCYSPYLYPTPPQVVGVLCVCADVCNAQKKLSDPHLKVYRSTQNHFLSRFNDIRPTGCLSM